MVAIKQLSTTVSRRGAVLVKRGWRAAGWSFRGGPCAAAEPASRGAVAAERQPAGPGSHARLPAIRERSCTRAGKPGCAARWPARLAAAVPRSSSASCSSSGRPMRPHAPVIAFPGHPLLEQHASPQPMVSQRHQLEQQACGVNDVRMRVQCADHGWGGAGAPPLPCPSPPPLVSDQPWLNQYYMLYGHLLQNGVHRCSGMSAGEFYICCFRVSMGF
jgi:hypothetical protein